MTKLEQPHHDQEHTELVMNCLRWIGHSFFHLLSQNNRKPGSVRIKQQTVN